jgi:membrane dipeptidase
MGALTFTDHRGDPKGWAQALGISEEAVALYLASDVIDLHIETYTWTRAVGYQLPRRHGTGLFRARLYGQVDLPRLREARVTGGVWALTTNPFRRAAGRPGVLLENLAGLRAVFDGVSEDVSFVRTADEYRRVVDAGRHAAWICIQGGNALDSDLGAIGTLPDNAIISVTLVHLYSSALGKTSAPSLGRRRGAGLSDLGKDFVRRLNARRILVDLAHINRRGFFDAVEIHDKSQPLIVTHTGVAGVHPHWRNVDDEQMKAIADTGGTIGVMYQSSFLGDPWLGGRCATVVDHLAHIIQAVGEDFASLGSDWDGLINPPRDMPTCLELPRLVQRMLERGWTPDRIRKVLGGNFLRVVRALRG